VIHTRRHAIGPVGAEVLHQTVKSISNIFSGEDVPASAAQGLLILIRKCGGLVRCAASVLQTHNFLLEQYKRCNGQLLRMHLGCMVSVPLGCLHCYLQKATYAVILLLQ